jgi:phosphatidate cytidylyltransferase
VALVVLAAGAAIGFHEVAGLLRAMGLFPLRVEGTLLAVGLVVAYSFPNWGAGAVLAATIAALPLGYILRRLPVEKAFGSIAGTLLGVLLVGVFLGFLMGLRRVGWPADPWLGGRLLLFLCLVVCPADIGAYYVGTAFGRTKLAPHLSPKKTWEGLAGGIAASLLGAAAAKLLFLPVLSWPHVLVLGAGLSVMGALGDLSVSLLKRSAGVKDMGRLLPGHGGMLDRFDSWIFASPALFYYWKYAVAR